MTVITEQSAGWPWPTGVTVTRGVERYFQFLQRQGDFNRKLAISWVAAMAPTPRAIRRQTPGIERATASHRDLVAGHADAGEDMTSDLVEHEPTDRLAEQNLRRNDLFDSLVDSLLDADILATIR